MNPPIRVIHTPISSIEDGIQVLESIGFLNPYDAYDCAFSQVGVSNAKAIVNDFVHKQFKVSKIEF